MFRRSVLELSSRRCIRRIPRKITTQIPAFLNSRKEFSTASQQNASQGGGSGGKPSESKSNLSKFVVGSVVIGAAALSAYQFGYLDQFLGEESNRSLEQANIGVTDKEGVKYVKQIGEPVILPKSDESSRSSPDAEHAEQKMSVEADAPHIEALMEGVVENQSQVEDKSDLTPEETPLPIQDKELAEHPHVGAVSEENAVSEEQSSDSGISTGGSLDMKRTDNETSTLDSEGVQLPPVSTHEANDTKPGPFEQFTAEDMAEVAPRQGIEPPSSLLDAYDLREKDNVATSSSVQGTNDYIHPSSEEEALVSKVEDSNDAYVSKDGKLVLDFLQAIHAAEKRQAELDAHVFSEEKRILKEKYEKNLKDARARELMYAEEAAILDKELNKERAKAAAAIKSLQEKAEEKLKMKLEQKENEAKLELKKIQELAKAELAAAIASEKASQIEKMAEANLHINALCMAFYAHSEEARQTHYIHKLALGALALEDTLSRGLPVQKEIEALHPYLEGIDTDSLVDLVLSSLPEETRNSGTDTPLQLNQKFDALKVTLRHFSLIPPNGGGILAHSLAYIASWVKVKEVDRSGDGIESVINRVESYLAEGKLVEAADTLEESVKGSQAAEVVGDWVRRARNRAITEQALTLLQSYATSVSVA